MRERRRSQSPATEQVIALWPAAAPGSESLTIEETTSERSADPAHPDRVVAGVTCPTLTAYVPAAPNGSSLIVAAGGGYHRQVVDKEGSEIAHVFVARGVTVFVLKYRLPSEGHQHAADVPLQDGQRAIRVVRSHAAAWKLAPNRIAFMGFSAAGHLASTLATRFADTVYAPVDEADHLDARPDAVVLLYPVITMEDGITHAGSRTALLGRHPRAAEIAAHSTDLHVSAKTPPTLLVLAGDDTTVSPDHSIRFYQALRRANVPAELHIYAKGGHGFGVRHTHGLPVAAWPEVACAWLCSVGILPAAHQAP